MIDFMLAQYEAVEANSEYWSYKEHRLTTQVHGKAGLGWIDIWCRVTSIDS
jgi:hypothetical protein